MNILNVTAAALAASLLAGAGFAQNAESNSSSSSKSVIVISRDGKTYKKVIENGKVVEESGDKSLGKDVDIRIGTGDKPDLDKLIERARRAGGKPKSSKSSSSSSKSAKRRVVVKDGKTIVDESSGDIDTKDLPKEVRDLLDGKDLDVRKLIDRVRKSDKTKNGGPIIEVFGDCDLEELDLPVEITDLLDGRTFDFEKMIGKAMRGIDSPMVRSHGRVIVKENGETIVDELLEDLGDMDLSLDLSDLLDGVADDVVIEVPEIEIDEVRDLPNAVRKALEDLDMPKAESRKPRKLERRARPRRSRGNTEQLESEIKRLRREIDALQRKLDKLDRRDDDGEQFA